MLNAIRPAAQKLVMEPWCRTLGEESGSRLACQFHPAMQLGGTPAQLVDLAGNGVADIVWTAPGCSAGRFPIIETMELPFVVRGGLTGSRAAWNLFQRQTVEEFAACKVLAVHVDSGVAFHTAGRPVAGLDSLKGQKLRASTRMVSKTLTALGATLGPALSEPPYGAPPKAPVLYIKPRNTHAGQGATLRLPRGAERVEVAATLGLCGRPSHPDVRAAIEDGIARVAQAGKAPGVLATEEALARACRAAGALFVGVGVGHHTVRARRRRSVRSCSCRSGRNRAITASRAFSSAIGRERRKARIPAPDVGATSGAGAATAAFPEGLPKAPAPVLTTIPFQDEADADAVAIANDVPYALSGYVWTRDVGRANRVAPKLGA